MSLTQLQIQIQDYFSTILTITWDARFLWVPAILALALFKLWMYYIHARFIKEIEWITLEIKLPREILKSPQAMEVVLNGLHLTKNPNAFEKYWKGLVGNPWMSLEMVGIEGEIHFFVRCWKFHRNLVEAQFYAHYPDVEIIEVDDYSNFSLSDDFTKEWNAWGTEFALVKEDAYPIKTYVDYGLHETMTKEEQKTDPISSFLEVLGGLKEGEQIWFQILIRATKKKWQDDAAKLVDEIMQRDEKPVEGEVSVGALKLSPGEKDVVQAIERDVAKLGFDVGIRALYLARQDNFSAINIPAIIGSMKQYSAPNLNGFKPSNSTSVDYGWQFKKVREAGMKTRMIDAYRKRSYFHIPYERKPFILNTEELATIFHFPGSVSETPTFGRIDSKKSEPPAGLPV